MFNQNRDMKILTGNSNPKLAKDIADYLDVPILNADVNRFSDGEIAVTINEVVRGSDVYIIQSTCPPVNENLMELLVLIDAVKRASAGRVTAVIPYFGYARQDRKAKARDPISAKLVANLLTVAGADRVLTMDLHVPQLQGFFDIPVDHLAGIPILAKHFQKEINPDEYVVVSPDVGSVGRARKFAELIGTSLAIIDKRRPKANVAEILNVIGEVKDKKVIIVDDLIDTAGTICNAAEAMLKLGAVEVSSACTHAVLSGPAIERIQNSSMKKLITLNTVPVEGDKKIDKIETLTVSTIFAQAVERINTNQSMSTLFTQK